MHQTKTRDKIHSVPFSSGAEAMNEELKLELEEEAALVNLNINGQDVACPENWNLIMAARKAGYEIPSLCYLRGINENSSCRVCLVDVARKQGEDFRMLTACSTKVAEGMVVRTNSTRVRKTVRLNLELIKANHNSDCLSCIRNDNCEFQRLCAMYGVQTSRFTGAVRAAEIDDLSWSVVRDPGKCILCGRCVNTCKKVQGIGVLEFSKRGFETTVGPAFGYSMKDVNCLYCGQCIEACPVGALHEKDQIEEVLKEIENPDKFVIVQTAPAVRAALGEEFGYPIGTAVTGKMVAALRRLGFDRVYDTNFAADLTIMEEATELISRLKNNERLPLLTSCSPGWVRYCELYYPEFLENISSCKSPQQMMGAVIKSYYAERVGVDPESIVSVSVMPCTAKKTEANRPEMEVDGLRDVDYSLTTRELSRMIRQSGLQFKELADEQADSILGDYTGAGVIFGTSGGVMEAALRTAADILTGEDLADFEYSEVRGMEGIKEAAVLLPFEGKEIELKVAVVSSAANAAKVLDAVKAGDKTYHFIEVMACPGGCIHGGGQPYVPARERIFLDPRPARAKALYDEDLAQNERKSYKNSDVQELYKRFFGEPNSERAHKYLHTHYEQREVYPLKEETSL